MKDMYADVEHWATVNLIRITAETYLISGWEINRKFRRKGYASALFDQVMNEADKEHKTLMLSVDPDGTGLDEIALFNFYESRGFVRMNERLYAMTREPRNNNANL